jgi:hypothetical protein
VLEVTALCVKSISFFEGERMLRGAMAVKVLPVHQ